MTGLAWYDVAAGDFQSGQYGPDDLVRKLDQLGAVHAARMVLGYEKFIATSGGARTSSSSHSQRAIRVLDDWAYGSQVPVLRSQPSSARNLGQVVWLRRLGWYKPGKGHANDAAQHLLADLLKRQPMPHAIRAKLFPGYTARGNLAT
jgi:hypothetical protein